MALLNDASAASAVDVRAIAGVAKVAVAERSRPVITAQPAATSDAARIRSATTMPAGLGVRDEARERDDDEHGH